MARKLIGGSNEAEERFTTSNLYLNSLLLNVFRLFFVLYDQRNCISLKEAGYLCWTLVMPLLNKKPFRLQPVPADLKADEEVFVCPYTKEVFRNYE